jgi:hypothetical protein
MPWAQGPLVLDFDGSVGALPGEQRVPLSHWQEDIRFGCTLRHWRRLLADAEVRLPAPGRHGTVFMGSGDFHHLSWWLVERQLRAQPAAQPLRVVVLDNHPDNMRYPFGVHCGSWVRRVAMLPGVSQVIVAGITSGDIGLRHAWENQLAPLRAGKLACWSIGVDTAWPRWLGLGAAFRNFSSADNLVDALATLLRTQPQPSYLSIDKDVLSPDNVHTNWDQGLLGEAHLLHVVGALRGQLVGADVTGEVSAYRYRSRWKRWLSAADAQDTGTIDATQLARWQAGQHALNQRLLGAIDALHHSTT